MKITITLEIDGVPVATKNVNAFEAVDGSKPRNIFEGHPEWEKQEHDRLLEAIRHAKEEIQDQCKPLGELVPDEKEPPELLPQLAEDELAALRNDHGDIAEAAPEPEPKPKKLGLYKKKVKACDDPKSPPKYLGPNTVAEIFKTEGMTINLPGIQTTSKKFVVANAYFKGDLHEARDEYRQYVIEQHKHYPLDDMILTWESWLCNIWNKKE